MTGRPDITPVPLPPVATGRKAHLLSTYSLNTIRAGLQRLANRQRMGGGPISADTIPPFMCFSRYDPVGAKYYVTATPGYVCERDIVAGASVDALDYIQPTNMFDGAHPREFEIGVNEALFVEVPELASGAVDAANIVLSINVDTTESSNYIPSVQAGIYYYKLAALKTVDGVTMLAYYMAGSHIYHVSGLTADFVIRACPVGTEDPAQIGRLSFLSGRLRAMNETEGTRAYAPALGETDPVNIACT